MTRNDIEKELSFYAETENEEMFYENENRLDTCSKIYALDFTDIPLVNTIYEKISYGVEKLISSVNGDIVVQFINWCA